jgi:hypothetical protein
MNNDTTFPIDDAYVAILLAQIHTNKTISLSLMLYLAPFSGGNSNRSAILWILNG